MLTIVLLLVFIAFFSYFAVSRNTKVAVGSNLKITVNKNRIPKQIYILMIFVFVIFVGLRAKTVGLDSKSYAGDIGSSISELQYSNYEYGYIFLVRLISIFNLHYSVLFLVAAIIAIAPIVFLIKEESDYPVLSIIVYFGTTLFLWSFSALRQSMALGLVACSYFFIKRKKRIRFLVFVLLASLFHKTAIFFAPTLIFSFVKVDKKRIFLIIGIGIMLIVLQNQILNMASSFSRVDSYFDVEMEGGERYLLVLFFVAILSIIQYKNMKNDPFIFYSLVLLPFIFFVVNKNSVMNRASWYYQLILIVGIPRLVKSFKTKTFRVCLYGILAILFGYQFLSSIMNDVAGIANYQFAF